MNRREFLGISAGGIALTSSLGQPAAAEADTAAIIADEDIRMSLTFPPPGV